MGRAVVFDDEAVVGVVKVRASEKRGCIAKRHLDLGTREAGEHEKHPEAGLHGTLGRWLDILAVAWDIFQLNQLLV